MSSSEIYTFTAEKPSKLNRQNLSFRKLIERLASGNLHLSLTDILPSLFSLPINLNNKARTDLIMIQRHCVYLVVIELNAAFDTVNHHVFLRQSQYKYGFSCGTVDWMSSYLRLLVRMVQAAH